MSATEEDVIRSLKEAVADQGEHRDHHVNGDAAPAAANGNGLGHDQEDGYDDVDGGVLGKQPQPVNGKHQQEEDEDEQVSAVSVQEDEGYEEVQQQAEEHEKAHGADDHPTDVRQEEEDFVVVEATAVGEEEKSEAAVERTEQVSPAVEHHEVSVVHQEAAVEHHEVAVEHHDEVAVVHHDREEAAAVVVEARDEVPDVHPSQRKEVVPERSQSVRAEWLSKRQTSLEMKREVEAQSRPTINKAAMSTSIDEQSVRAAYEDVRADTSDTDWAVFKFKDQSVVCSATGAGFDSFRAHFADDDRAFGFIRIQMGDEMSKRQKFVFLTWVGPRVSVIRRAKMSIDKAMVKNIIKNFAVELQVETQSEINEDHFREQLARAGGANYGTGFRDY